MPAIPTEMIQLLEPPWRIRKWGNFCNVGPLHIKKNSMRRIAKTSQLFCGFAASTEYRCVTQLPKNKRSDQIHGVEELSLG